MNTFASRLSKILLACELDVLYAIYDRMVAETLAKKFLKDTSKILSDRIENQFLSENRVRQDYDQSIWKPQKNMLILILFKKK